MSTHQIVTTAEAPGPYSLLSQATVHNGMVFCAGALGMDPKTNKLVEGTIAERTVSPRFHFSTFPLPNMIRKGHTEQFTDSSIEEP